MKKTITNQNSSQGGTTTFQRMKLGKRVSCIMGIMLSLFVMNGYAQRAYISNGNDNSISVLDVANSNALLHLITASGTNVPGQGISADGFTGVTPGAVAISPDGNWVYVANWTTGTVNVINACTYHQDYSFGVGPNPIGLRISPDGNSLYISLFGNPGFAKAVNVNPTTHTFNQLWITMTQYFPCEITISPNGSHVYATGTTSNFVFDIDAASGTILNGGNPIIVGNYPRPICVSPSGNNIYVGNSNDGSVSVIDAATDAVFATIVPEAGATALYGVCVSPDGNTLYTEDYNTGHATKINVTNLSISNPGSYNIVSAVTVGAGPLGINFKPDGTQVYVKNNSGTTVSVINASNNTLASTVTVGNAPGGNGIWMGAVPTACCTAPTVPTLSASFPSVCPTQSTTLSIATGTLNSATNWQWYSGSCGGTSVGTGTSVTVTPTVTTTYYARGTGGCVTAGSCGSITITVNSLPTAPSLISGPNGLCGTAPGTTLTYTVPFDANANPTGYTWTHPSGMIGTSNTNTLTVQFNSLQVGNITCTASNNCGTSAPATLALSGKPPIPGAITPGTPANMCQPSTATFSIAAVPGAADCTANGTQAYRWSVGNTSGFVLNSSNTTGLGTTSVTITFPSTFVEGDIRVSAWNCCGALSGYGQTLHVIAHAPATPTTLSGPPNVCGLTSATYFIASVPTATTGYNWTITGAGNSINGSNTGSSVNVILNGTTGGSISCSKTNACGNSTPNILNFSIAAIQPGAISGSTNLCGSTSSVYFIADVTPAGQAPYTYTWSSGMSGWSAGVPNSVLATGGISTNTFTGSPTGPTHSGNVTVTATNGCGNTSARNKSVTYCHNAIAMNNGEESGNNTISDIYPNPATSDFTIYITSETEQAVTVEVYDVLGNKVIQQKHTVVIGESTLKTNLDEFKKGMYFVRLLDVDSNVIHSQTLIKQ